MKVKAYFMGSKETIYMKCQSLLYGKNEKNIISGFEKKCEHLWKLNIVKK